MLLKLHCDIEITCYNAMQQSEYYFPTYKVSAKKFFSLSLVEWKIFSQSIWKTRIENTLEIFLRKKNIYV